jgi:transposase-like protein
MLRPLGYPWSDLPFDDFNLCRIAKGRRESRRPFGWCDACPVCSAELSLRPSDRVRLLGLVLLGLPRLGLRLLGEDLVERHGAPPFLLLAFSPCGADMNEIKRPSCQRAIRPLRSTEERDEKKLITARSYETEYEATRSITVKVGIGSAETLRKWVRQSEIDAGKRPVASTEEPAELRAASLRKQATVPRQRDRAGGILGFNPAAQHRHDQESSCAEDEAWRRWGCRR